MADLKQAQTISQKVQTSKDGSVKMITWTLEEEQSGSSLDPADTSHYDASQSQDATVTPTGDGGADINVRQLQVLLMDATGKAYMDQKAVVRIAFGDRGIKWVQIQMSQNIQEINLTTQEKTQLLDGHSNLVFNLKKLKS